MKKVKIIALLCLLIVFVSACGNKKTKPQGTEAVKNTTEATSEKLSTEEEALLDDEDPVEYSTAAYFNHKIEKIIYYNQGKKIEIAPETKEGKVVLKLIKKRFIHTTEIKTEKNLLKKKVTEIKKHQKAVEVEFVKSKKQLKDERYRIPVDCKAWFFPLDESYEKYFTPLPNQELTLQRLGSATELIQYLDQNCVKQ